MLLSFASPDIPGRSRTAIRAKVGAILAVAFSILAGTDAPVLAQEAPVAPELLERMAKEKQARRACKVDICNAFAKPEAGPPIACNVTKTWIRPEITGRIPGGDYIWRYGHVQCTVKLSLSRDLIAKAAKENEVTVDFPEHLVACIVDDADPAKGKAFTASVTITPAITFERGGAKSVSLAPVKTEGSTMASAAVTSLMAADKISGIVSRAAAAEINTFLFDKCKADGIEISRK